MVRPEFLRTAFWPHVKYSMEPYLDAGIRFIHHCDGNVMPLVDDMVAAGYSGFQGFQYECGVDIYELRKHRSLKGEEMLIMGGLSVTRTLPFGTPGRCPPRGGLLPGRHRRRPWIAAVHQQRHRRGSACGQSGSGLPSPGRL